MKHTFKIITLLALTGVIHSCIKKDNDEDLNSKKNEEQKDTTQTPTDTIKWSAHIKPIIDNKCAISGCHGNSQPPILKTYAQVFANRTRIKARAVNEGSMPPMGHTPLTTTEKQQIAKWIDAGALEN